MDKKPKLKMLVVEDRPDMLKMEAWTLQEMWPEAQIETASDGNEAVRKLFDLCPDLLVTDIRIPGPNGIELCSLVRENPYLFRHTKVIAVTGFHEPEINEQALVCGADEYLVKPVEPYALRHSAARLLGPSSAGTSEFSNGKQT